MAEPVSKRPPRFLVDRTLGRLARWLRLLGYDTVWEPAAEPAALLRRAADEGRLLLTRDTLLVERRPVRRGAVRAVLVQHDHLEDQLRQLRLELGLRKQDAARCLVCNAVTQARSIEQVRHLVPPYVAQTQTAFAYCPVCARVTWAATHWANACRLFQSAGFL